MLFSWFITNQGLAGALTERTCSGSLPRQSAKYVTRQMPCRCSRPIVTSSSSTHEHSRAQREAKGMHSILVTGVLEKQPEDLLL